MVSREEFEEFAAEVQKKLDDFARGQQDLANLQADTGENLNKAQAETNSKLDRLERLLTGLLARESTPPDHRRQLDMDRGSSFAGISLLGAHLDRQQQLQEQR